MGALRKRFLTVRPEKGKVMGWARVLVSVGWEASRTCPWEELDGLVVGDEVSAGAEMVDVSYSIFGVLCYSIV